MSQIYTNDVKAKLKVSTGRFDEPSTSHRNTNDTLHLLQQATRQHVHVLDIDLSLPNLALLLAVVAQSSFHAALTRPARLFINKRFYPETLLVHRLASLEQQGRLADLPPGIHHVRLKQHDADGPFQYSETLT